MSIQKQEKDLRLIRRSRALPPTPCAVAHPGDESPRRGTVEAPHSEGASAPVILTRSADSMATRLASCAVAALVAQARRADPKKAVAR